MNKLINAERLNAEDYDFFELFNRRTQDLPKDGKHVAIRPTKKFLWALDVYKRFLSPGGNLTDAEILEHCLWESIRKENPLYSFTLSTRDKYQALLTKIFYEGKNEKEEDLYKYTSVIDLTWSEFSIFRTIKLAIAEPDLLNRIEKEIIDFIKQEEKFWYGDSRSLKFGTLKAHALCKTFEVPREVVLTRTLFDKKDKPIKAKPITVSKTQYELLEEDGGSDFNFQDIKVIASTEEEEDVETNMLSAKRFDLDYMYSRPGTLEGDTPNVYVVANFSLEIKRLNNLVEKYCKF